LHFLSRLLRIEARPSAWKEKPEIESHKNRGWAWQNALSPFFNLLFFFLVKPAGKGFISDPTVKILIWERGCGFRKKLKGPQNMRIWNFTASKD
jgi:hypothetical protein